MLQKMRDQTQSLAFKVLVGIIVFVLAVFGFGAFNLFVTGDPEVASVNGDGITQAELAVATERERRSLAARMGGEFDPSMIDPVRLQGAVLDQLIARKLLSQAADDLGLAVGPSRVDQVLVENPTFQVNGRFQRDLYRQTIQAMGYTPQGFLDDTAESLTLEQLQSSVTDTAFLTRRELNEHAALLAQRRDVAYLPFGLDRFREQVTVSDDDVAVRYQENERDYVTEETVDVAYVALGVGDLVDDPAITISEADVRSAYEVERAAAPQEEERRSRHILLETSDSRSAEAATAVLEDVGGRIAAGESFADLAKELSEDPGSASQGGDLGFAGRGVFDPQFESALFALAQPGDVSEPVRTEFGVHLIQLEEIRSNPYPEFDQVRADIESRMRREQAALLYDERLRELDSLAFEHPNDLSMLTENLGLEVQSVDGVTRTSGAPPFDSAELRDRLFSADVLQKGFNSAAVEIGDGRAVVVRVRERHPPEPIPFEAVADDIRSAIEAERAQTLLEESQLAALTRLRAGDGVSEVAESYGVNWQTFESVRRNTTEVPRAVLQAAFALPHPEAGGKSIGEARLPDGGGAVVTVTRVEDGDVQALTEAELSGMQNFLADRVARLEFAALFETLRAEASVQRSD
ncbi:MAG: SurA N-terminal domain-containing protein [Pseudomonadales bacterium]